MDKSLVTSRFHIVGDGPRFPCTFRLIGPEGFFDVLGPSIWKKVSHTNRSRGMIVHVLLSIVEA